MTRIWQQTGNSTARATAMRLQCGKVQHRRKSFRIIDFPTSIQCHAPATRKSGIEVRRLGWPALRTNGVLQPQLARRPINPLVFAERSAPPVQSTGRSSGQGDKMALVASSPCILAHRPLQRQCSARATNPAPTAFRSMYRKTVNRCSSVNTSCVPVSVPGRNSLPIAHPCAIRPSACGRDSKVYWFPGSGQLLSGDWTGRFPSGLGTGRK